MLFSLHLHCTKKWRARLMYLAVIFCLGLLVIYSSLIFLLIIYDKNILSFNYFVTESNHLYYVAS